jgi:hypothetical protein
LALPLELGFLHQLGYIKGYDKAVLLYRQIFKNKDGSIGIIHLVSSVCS